MRTHLRNCINTLLILALGCPATLESNGWDRPFKISKLWPADCVKIQTIREQIEERVLRMER